MHKFWSSIRFKTVGVQIAGALAITISLAIASFVIIKQYILRSHLDHSHMIVRTASDELNDFFLERQALMERITMSREFEEYLKTFRDLPLSRHFSKFDKHFSALAFINKEGAEEVRIMGGKHTDVVMNYRNSAYFKRSLQHPNTIIISSPESSPVSGGPVLQMFLTKTGYFGDEFIGTLMTELPLSMIETSVEKMSEGQKGFIAVIDQAGQVLVCTSGNKNHLNRTMDQKVLGMAGSPDHETNYVRSTVFGTDSLVTASPVKNMPWTALRIAPYNNITDPLMSLMKSILIMLAIVMVLTIIASIIISGQITKRVIELSDATADIARGDFTLNVPVTSTDEIGRLAESFNTMVNTLLTTTVSRAYLEEKNAFLQHVVDSIPYPFLWWT